MFIDSGVAVAQYIAGFATHFGAIMGDHLLAIVTSPSGLRAPALSER